MLSQIQCLICYNKLDSKYFFFKNCKHFLCFKCGVNFNACPICTNQSIESIKIELIKNKKNNSDINDKVIKDLVEKNYGKITLKFNDDDSYDENDDTIFEKNDFQESEFNINNNTKKRNGIR